MRKRKLLTAMLVCMAVSLSANAYELSGTFSDLFVDSNQKTDSTPIGGGKSNIGGVGGVLVRGTNATDNYSVLNSKFISNHAYYDGGAIANYGKNLKVLNSEFIGNTAQLTKDASNKFTVAVSDSTPLGGGAMALGSESTTIITETLFQNNVSGTNGGAIATRLWQHGNNSAAQLDITGSKFINNTAVKNGGAIYNSFYNSSATEVQGVNISDNEFTGNEANFGGAVYNSGALDKGGSSAILTAVSNTFSENKATVVGGAMFNGGTATVADSTFNTNEAGSAGAVYNSGTFTTQGNTSFTENKVNGSGGAIMNNGTLSLKDNTAFTNNKSVDAGGAIYNDSVAAITGNATFTKNSSNQGGAIANITGGSLTVNGATFDTNDATFGGAVINDNSTASFTNTTFTGNTAKNGAGIYSTNAGTVTVSASTLKNNIASGLGGAICNDKSTLTITDTDIMNNKAAHGAGIYTNDDVVINAVSKNVTMSGNIASVAGNDLFVDNSSAKVSLNAAADKSITIASGISGVNGYNIAVNSNSANTGTIVLNSAIENAAISVQNGTFHLAQGSALNNSTLSMASGSTLNTIDNKVSAFGNNITLANNTNLAIDVDIESGKADNFSAANISGKVVITDVNTMGIMEAETGSINLAEAMGIDPSKLSVSEALQAQTQTILSPIRYFQGSISPTGMMTMAPRGNSYRDFNPAVMASPVAAQVGGYLTQLNSYDQAFRNMDMYMLMTKKQRKALKLRNKYASADGNQIFDPIGTPNDDKSVWVRPYATFENVPLKGGPRVSNVAYGSFFGGDSELYDLGHGWDGMFGVYVGYNGSHQAYDGISIYQNGGTIGLTGMAFKDNFFTGLTLNAGANAGEASTIYGMDNFSMLMAGIASKTGYNWELADGKFIIQPSFMMSYSFVNTFDYTNAAGVHISSDPLNAIQVEPGIKFIGNMKNGWQPYAGVSVVWNIMDKTNFNANNVSLPELSVKPFVRYGVGLRKSWGERCVGFFQTYFTNGGRNGVGLQAGFRFTLGKDPSSSTKTSNKTPVLKKTEIKLGNMR